MTAVEGLARLKAKLARMPQVAKERMREALIKSADELVKNQKALALRSRRTGRLMDSIHRRDGEHELSQEVVAGEGAAFYARFVEFGTVEAPSQPFFFAPFRLLRKSAKGRAARAVNKAVKEVVGG